MSEEPISYSTGVDPAETTDTNAGPDALDGGVALAEPTDPGDQKPMDDFGGGEEPEPKEE